jgi:hypothetical protein
MGALKVTPAAGGLTASQLREFLDDIDPDAPVVISVRCVHNHDAFHEPHIVDDVSADQTFGDVVILSEVWCAGDDDHPDPTP